MSPTRRPPDPVENNVRTFYARPLLDRPTGRYTVAWDVDGRTESIRVHNRLCDLEGHRLPLAELMRVPRTLRTYFEAKRRTILRRPLPFLVYGAIEHLATLIGPGTRVVELGGGNSTLWFLGRGARVTTIEHSPEWAETIRGEADQRSGGERLEVIVASGERAIDAATALEERSFDVALVDCMNEYTWRKAGVEVLYPKLRPGGTLCLDNSDHPNNWAAVTMLGRERRRRFTGLAPMCPVVTQTSVWVNG